MGYNGDGQPPFRIVGQRRTLEDVARTPLPAFGGSRWIFGYLGASAVAVLIVAVFRWVYLLAEVNVNTWWFDSIGLGSVWSTLWGAQVRLFLEYGFITYLVLTAIYVATRLLTYRPGPDPVAQWMGSATALLLGFTVAAVSMVVGFVMASLWQQYLLAAHSQSFGILDPVHHRDIGFYVFSFPWRQTLGNFGLALFLLAGIELGAVALVFTGTSPYQTQQGDIRRITAIGSFFAAGLFSFLAWRNFFIHPYDLTRPGTVFGGGATFVHASLWWYPIVGTVEVITALVLLVNTFVRRVSLAWVALLPIVVGGAASAGQGIFQHFVVSPNELSAEYRYLGYTLNSTRHAYGIDGWKVKEYTPHTLTTQDVATNSQTVKDLRVADTGAFTQVMRQRQENRTYYGFNTADIDRYSVNGKTRQVLLAGRELAYTKLPTQAQTWVNEHIKFTHGYGLTVAPANRVTADGQPELWVQNIPVQETVSGLPPVTQPRLYFGEFTDSWILTGATTPEFDSSSADQDTQYRYVGPDGVQIGSGLRRLTLSWVQEGGFPFFNRLNISGYVRPSTRILLHRSIYDRVSTIAPWLRLDSDPYLVLRKNGSLVWILDGLTSTDDYPYSQRTAGANYMRNSVKVVVDAYTGRTTFYAFGPRDPIREAWSSAFPGLIHPFAEMPADLKAHIKYPDDYLEWQALGYDRYHVTDVTSYYNGDNQWDIENSTQYNWDDGQIETNQVPPIWTLARLFGEKHESFFSILPFSVHGKATMAGYIAADNNTYHVTALDMPRGAQTTGVTQFESLYQQAPSISSTLTLLDQRGSEVVPGQMIILPVGKALLYMKPLYLRSASSQSLPQLVRVVMGTQNEVNWGFRVTDALDNLLTQGDISTVSGTTPGTGTGTGTTPSPATPPLSTGYAKLSDAQLIALAEKYYAAAQSTPSLSAKDRDLKQVGIILSTLRARHPK